MISYSDIRMICLHTVQEVRFQCKTFQLLTKRFSYEIFIIFKPYLAVGTALTQKVFSQQLYWYCPV